MRTPFFLGTTLVALALAGAALAEEAGSLSFTVHPYRGDEDAGAEARRRQELLSRRLDESEFALRAICRQCSRAIDHTLSPIPFNPLDTLSRPREARR